MAFVMKPNLSLAVAFTATAALAYGAYALVNHLEETRPQESGTCEKGYYAEAKDCLAKDADGNPISIAIDTPATPKP